MKPGGIFGGSSGLPLGLQLGQGIPGAATGFALFGIVLKTV